MRLEDRPFALELGQRGHDLERQLLDAVRSFEAAPGVERQLSRGQVQRLGALHGDAAVGDADTRDERPPKRRFADDCDVADVAAIDRALRSRLAGLLSHDALHDDVPPKADAACLQRL